MASKPATAVFMDKNVFFFRKKKENGTKYEMFKEKTKNHKSPFKPEE
jgi:hypothetical protein